jgi:hypothetical protein
VSEHLGVFKRSRNKDKGPKKPSRPMAIDDVLKQPAPKDLLDEPTNYGILALILRRNYEANAAAGNPHVSCPECTAKVPEERAYERFSAGVKDANGVPMTEWRHYCPVCEHNWQIPKP